MTNLKFTGENPVVINYSGNSDDIFAPVRTSSCDINLVSPELLTDLYTAKKDDVCVRIEYTDEEIVIEGKVEQREIKPAWTEYKEGSGYHLDMSINNEAEGYLTHNIPSYYKRINAQGSMDRYYIPMSMNEYGFEKDRPNFPSNDNTYAYTEDGMKYEIDSDKIYDKLDRTKLWKTIGGDYFWTTKIKGVSPYLEENTVFLKWDKIGRKWVIQEMTNCVYVDHTEGTLVEYRVYKSAVPTAYFKYNGKDFFIVPTVKNYYEKAVESSGFYDVEDQWYTASNKIYLYNEGYFRYICELEDVYDDVPSVYSDSNGWIYIFNTTNNAYNDFEYNKIVFDGPNEYHYVHKYSFNRAYGPYKCFVLTESNGNYNVKPVDVNITDFISGSPTEQNLSSFGANDYAYDKITSILGKLSPYDDDNDTGYKNIYHHMNKDTSTGSYYSPVYTKIYNGYADLTPEVIHHPAEYEEYISGPDVYDHYEKQTIHHDAVVEKVLIKPERDENVVIPAWDEEQTIPAWDENINVRVVNNATYTESAGSSNQPKTSDFAFLHNADNERVMFDVKNNLMSYEDGWKTNDLYDLGSGYYYFSTKDHIYRINKYSTSYYDIWRSSKNSTNWESFSSWLSYKDLKVINTTKFVKQSDMSINQFYYNRIMYIGDDLFFIFNDGTVYKFDEQNTCLVKTDVGGFYTYYRCGDYYIMIQDRLFLFDGNNVKLINSTFETDDIVSNTISGASGYFADYEGNLWFSKDGNYYAISTTDNNIEVFDKIGIDDLDFYKVNVNIGSFTDSSDHLQPVNYYNQDKIVYYSTTNRTLSNISKIQKTKTIHHPEEKVIVHHPEKTETVHIPAEYEDRIITPAYDEVKHLYYIYPKNMIWEGYMTPNTYSQEVSQNLDEIALTAIDPVSLLKYVTVDKIMTRPNVVTFEEIIAKSLAYVMITVNELYIERNFDYDGGYSLLDMKCQVSNFWDEAGEPGTLYSIIEEILRPFCLCLCYTGNSFYIYDTNKTETSTDRYLYKYMVNTDGTLTQVVEGGGNVNPSDHPNIKPDLLKPVILYDAEWKSNNLHTPVIEINSTYDKVTGVASTSKPEFSMSAFDLVNYNDRDKYDVGYLNVQRNKIDGGMRITGRFTAPVVNPNSYTVDEGSRWYYIWNGVYTNDKYGLVSNSGNVNGFLNINNAYQYLSGQNGTPGDLGSVLNFYGGVNNPVGTGKEQEVERAVEVKKRITAYAPDNGTVPEFLEMGDLRFNYEVEYGSSAEDYIPDIHWLKKVNKTSPKYGTPKPESIYNKIVYSQEYPNMALIEGNDQTVDISLTQSYSRTGIDSKIDVLPNSLTTNRIFNMVPGDDKFDPHLHSANVWTYPEQWASDKVVVNNLYFNKYRRKAFYDRRRIDLYVVVGDSIWQFNGKEWIQDISVSEANSFYLKKLMNDEKLFHTDHRYNLIECSDGETYSLIDTGFKFEGDHFDVEFEYYLKEENNWVKFVTKSNNGQLSIILPDINAVNTSVFCDVYNSNMLGMTGRENNSEPDIYYQIVYPFNGQYLYDRGKESERITDWLNINDIDSSLIAPDDIMTSGGYADFIPDNVTYVKAEHLDIKIEVSVPDSNLGQMFSESDIRYTIDNNSGYLEKFEGPVFLVNTYHPLVSASFSYIIAGDSVADPGLFVFDKIAARPETYVVQAYMNWLNTIRKIYKKTIVPLVYGDFNTIWTFIKSKEVSDKFLKVISDSWDIKTNRHTITAIEDHNLSVNDIQGFNVVEIPRKARNELYNLPSAYKK